MGEVKLLVTENLPILTQLQIEEAYLRATEENLILINLGSTKNIVMGIASKAEEMIDPLSYQASPCPIIKRFSGGGTVVVDHNTLFLSFIFNQKETSVELLPHSIALFIFSLLENWLETEEFKLLENDFVLGNRKIGGNAQYIQKERFVHHTTFLWDYTPTTMSLLANPTRQPKYREKRAHADFLTRLSLLFPSMESAKNKLIASLTKQLNCVPITLEEGLEKKTLPHRKSTVLIPPPF